MYTLLFKLLFAVFSKIVFTTALCTALLATRWYLHSFILGMIEWLEFLSYHKQTVILGLLFLGLLQLQRFLYQTRDFGKDWEPERLLESNERKSNTNFVENPSSTISGELDTILDFVLREVSGHIFGSQKIPDVDKTFEVPLPLGFGRRECRFTAVEGVVQHLDSVHRHGRATVWQRADGGLVLSAAAGLRAVSVRYQQYAAHVDMGVLPPIYVSGELKKRYEPFKGLCLSDGSPAGVRRETDGSPKMIGAMQMEPSLTLTPSTIAMGGGMAVGGIALLGFGLTYAIQRFRSRSGS